MFEGTLDNNWGPANIILMHSNDTNNTEVAALNEPISIIKANNSNSTKSLLVCYVRAS
jgi:hypothetical protein